MGQINGRWRVDPYKRKVPALSAGTVAPRHVAEAGCWWGMNRRMPIVESAGERETTCTDHSPTLRTVVEGDWGGGPESPGPFIRPTNPPPSAAQSHTTGRGRGTPRRGGRPGGGWGPARPRGAPPGGRGRRQGAEGIRTDHTRSATHGASGVRVGSGRCGAKRSKNQTCNNVE